MLKVTTTHLKEGWVRRNGVPRSDKATLVEYFIRHGDYLTLVTVVKDPVYLTEPFVRTSNWVLDPGFQLSPFSCIPTHRDRAAARTRCRIICPATNPYLTEFADAHGMPFEATRGGAETMYPGLHDASLRRAGGHDDTAHRVATRRCSLVCGVAAAAAAQQARSRFCPCRATCT